MPRPPASPPRARPGTPRGPGASAGSLIGSGRSVPSTEKAGRGAGRASISVVPDMTWHSTPAWSKISWANSYQEHLPSAAMWWMPKSSRSMQLGEPLAEVARVGGGADLVRDDQHLGPLVAQAQHRLDEVLAADPEAATRRGR